MRASQLAVGFIFLLGAAKRNCFVASMSLTVPYRANWHPAVRGNIKFKSINQSERLQHISDQQPGFPLTLLVIENDGETISGTRASTSTTTVEFETDAAYLSNPYLREQLKAHDCLYPHTGTAFIYLFLDCPTSPSIVLPRSRRSNDRRP